MRNASVILKLTMFISLQERLLTSIFFNLMTYQEIFLRMPILSKTKTICFYFSSLRIVTNFQQNRFSNKNTSQKTT